jgi:hypothetical protein
MVRPYCAGYKNGGSILSPPDPDLSPRDDRQHHVRGVLCVMLQNHPEAQIKLPWVRRLQNFVPLTP